MQAKPEPTVLTTNSVDLQVPEASAEAVARIIAATRVRLEKGLPHASFGIEPASHLVQLRKGRGR